eukprot:COSAG01_NODE_28995_length_647_cov_16.744526_1_plen_74_part_10
MVTFTLLPLAMVAVLPQLWANAAAQQPRPPPRPLQERHPPPPPPPPPVSVAEAATMAPGALARLMSEQAAHDPK